VATPAEHDPIEAGIARGEALSRAGEDDEAVAHFAALVARHPEDARVAFACAGALDSGGQEMEAAAEYRRAVDLGLPEDLLPQMYVQYGSTLRNVGDRAGAVALLEQGTAAYPDDLAMACFLALARYSAGRESTALAGLIEALLRLDAGGTSLFQRYQRSLGAYAADLRDAEASPQGHPRT
jgi:predicted Zn-dependent protease